MGGLRAYIYFPSLYILPDQRRVNLYLFSFSLHFTQSTTGGNLLVSFKVLDLEKTLYFSHQLFHEYYCACHVCNITDKEFQEFFEERKDDYQFEEVRRFLFGLIYDVYRDQGKLFIQ